MSLFMLHTKRLNINKLINYDFNKPFNHSHSTDHFADRTEHNWFQRQLKNDEISKGMQINKLLSPLDLYW